MPSEIVVQERRSALMVEGVTPLLPMQELQMQIVRTGDLDRLKQLMELERQWKADQAKQSFVEAQAAFKAEAIRVTKDKDNKQYSSKYTSLGNLVDTVTPYLSKHGLSVNWEIEQAEKIKVTCVLTHAMGHSIQVSMVAPPDASGQKNPIQQIKSTITYLKICTFESVCGLASVDGNLEDDGNAASQAEGGTLEGGVVDQFVSLIEGSGDQAELQANYFAARDAAEKEKDNDAFAAFVRAKDKRLGQIKGRK